MLGSGRAGLAGGTFKMREMAFGQNRIGGTVKIFDRSSSLAYAVSRARGDALLRTGNYWAAGLKTATAIGIQSRRET